MNKIIILFLVITNFSSVYASSGNEVGNGGDVLVCVKNKKDISVQLFDFFEFQNQHNNNIDERVGEHKDIAKEVIGQLQKHDASLAKLLGNRLASFMDNTQFVEEAQLTNIKDTQSLIKKPSKDCRVEQVAILKKKVLANEKKFLVNQRLWDMLSETNKAGLIMHELIYEYFSDLGEKNSTNARAFNAYIFSKEFFKVSTEDYWQMIRSMKVPHYK